MVRTPLIAANWKMHKNVAEAGTFIGLFSPAVAGLDGVEIVLCPPFTALATVGRGLLGTSLALGAQNMYKEEQGAFTGEVSPGMLRDLGVKYVILGHSERRAIFGEDDALIQAKVQSAYRHGLTSILCVGETLAEREAGQTEAVVVRQLEAATAGLSPDQAASLVVAYEPVWAIGTGRNASAADASAVCTVIRAQIRSRFGPAADSLRIQYGGSVKPENVSEFQKQPDIDGALVGGASLDPAGFAALVRAAAGANR